jgi:hypothetical protein
LILETIALGSELSVVLLDQTRHYFGGYYHVKVLAYCDIPLKMSYFENEAEFNQAEAKLGVSVRFERTLEKMAVPEADIESVRNQLVQSFHETTKAYLSVPDFAPRFVCSEYRKLLKKFPHTRNSRA